MKKFKKLTAICLSLFLLGGTVFLPKAEVSAEEAARAEKTVELLDLSAYDGGTVLTKSETVLPYNMQWGATDDYNDGIREVAELGSAIKVTYPTESGGTPLLKLNDSIRQSDLSGKKGVAMWINSSSAGTLRFRSESDCYIAGNSSKQWKEIICDVTVTKGEQYVYFPFDSFTLEDGTKVTAIDNIFYYSNVVFSFLDDSKGTVYIDKFGLYDSEKNITVVEEFDNKDNVHEDWLITSEIVNDITADSGKKALKLNFNERVEQVDNRQLAKVPNYEFSLDIPKAYRPYIKSVNMEFDNQSVAGTDTWDNTNLNYLLGITNGTDEYGKDVDQTTRVLGLGEQSTTKNITDLWKINNWYYTNAYDDTNNFVKWNEEDAESINRVLVAVTVPANAATDTYVLIKSVSITVEGTQAELAAAEKKAAEDSVLIADFEDGTLGSYLHNPTESSNSVQSNDSKNGVYAANGNYALKVTRPASQDNGDAQFKLDGRTAFYDGISFYAYNPNGTPYEAYCFFGNTADISNCYAQKVISIQPSGDYLKYTVWFDDLGAFNGRLQNAGTNGTSLTESQKATADFFEIRVPYAPEGSVFYFDYVCYEKHTGIGEAELDLEKATVTADNGYNDEETPAITKSAITYSTDGSKTYKNRAEDKYQGWMTAFDVTGKMTNADGVKLSLKNNSSDEIKVLAVLYESDNNTWKWGANPESVTLEADQQLTKELLYSGDIHKGTAWQIHNYYSEKNQPTEDENETIKQLRIYVWAPENAAAGGTVELNGVSILYGKAKLGSSMQNGKIELSSNGYYHGSSKSFDSFYENEKAVINILPDEGYMLVPGSVTATDSLGNKVEITREGFRNINSAYTYGLTFGKDDLTLSASFAPEAELLGNIAGEAVLNADNDIQFNYTVPLNNGKVASESGELYEAVGFGVICTAGDVLEKYGLESGLTVEEIEAGNFAGTLSTNIHITETEGAFYDYTPYFASFNAIIRDISESLKDKTIVARAYVEYYDESGKLCRRYDDTLRTAVFNNMYREGWVMTFSDSFDGSSVDTSKWQVLDNILINESSQSSCDAEMVSVENGMLKLSAVKEENTALTWSNEEKTVAYKTGRVETNGLFEQQYGRFEARIKYDEEDTIIPAFWMMPDYARGLQGEGDGKGAEIDIMEHTKSLVDSNDGRTYCTSAVHWGGYGEGHPSVGFELYIDNPWDWHTYALEWDESSYRFYIDGNLLKTFEGAKIDGFEGNGIAQCAEYLILSLTVGDWSSNSTVDDEKLPGNMYVDWVYAYKKG